MVSFDSVNKFKLSDITVHIPQGKTVGLIGASGAGKTTFIKLACGLLVPESGEVFTMRRNPAAGRQILGGALSVLFTDKPFLNKEDTVQGNFKMLGATYRLSGKAFREDYAELSRRLGFGAFEGELVKDLSLGQRRRAELGAALLHRPKLLLLDEPASGLDETARQEFRTLLDERKRKENMTVVLSSHDMSQISGLCDRLVLLHEGKLLFCGEEEVLRRRFLPLEELRLQLPGGMPDLEDLPLEKYYYEGEILRLVYRVDFITAAEILRFLLQKNAVTEVSIHKPNLGEIVGAEAVMKKQEESSGSRRIYKGGKRQ